MHPGPMNRGVEIARRPVRAARRRHHPAGHQRHRRADGRAVRPARSAAADLEEERMSAADHAAARVLDQTGERVADVARRRRPRRSPSAPTSATADDGARRRRLRRAPRASSTSTPTSASRARRRPRRSRPARRAAALGGYTAVVAMPNTDPTQDSRERRRLRARARARRPGCATCCPSGSHHDRPARASSWRRSPSSPPPACASSPTTATACRTRC